MIFGVANFTSSSISLQWLANGGRGDHKTQLLAWLKSVVSPRAPMQPKAQHKGREGVGA